MMRRLLLAFLPPLLLIALPLLLRPAHDARPGVAERRLVIITPHNEPTRYEFERAFMRHYAEHYGESITIEWRTPGGTSDITRFINDQFRIAFRRYWLAHPEHGAWTDTVASAFNNRRLDPADPAVASDARHARSVFLASEVGIGVDLFFGGGQFDHARQASMGHAVDAGIRERYPHWFATDIIPQEFSGETFYSADGRYYGVCLAAFGICYNKDRIAELSRVHQRDCAPTRWEHLGDPIFFKQTAIADPTKSGSINKCFEMIIQEQMQRAAAIDPETGPALGWAAGMNLIKRIGANARYLTDSASKVPADVARGDTAIGMGIDFYARAQAEWTRYQSGDHERMVYVTPAGGSSISADPIQLLRGAPEREAAIAFMVFALSEDGQRLWNFRQGTPGGPEKYVLRRLPIRRDMYRPEHRRYMADAEADPFREAADFEYRAAWTGAYFNLIRVFIKCMVLDPFPELQAAWAAIIRAGGPDKVPEAMAAFNALPFDYAGVDEANRQLRGDDHEDPFLAIRVQRQWAEGFRSTYRRAVELAEAGR